MPDIRDFETLFRGSVRAQLNWPALLKLGAPVTEMVTADWDVLGNIRTVWYFSSAGDPVDWSAEGARGSTIREAAELRRRWQPDRVSRVAYFRDQLKDANEPQVTLLPTYRLEGGLLLLDATHRLMAGYLDNTDLRALIMTIEGPATRQLLPDLEVK